MADLKFLDKLSASFELLPGVGKKTAKRYAYYVVEKLSSSDVDSFAKALIDTKNSITKCSNCGMLSLSECCEICSDKSRNRSKIMVLKDTKDIIAIENMGNVIETITPDYVFRAKDILFALRNMRCGSGHRLFREVSL